ncbi:unnamed protein product [Pleuronectes platessa]|uniref:Uncharacterized protein n=1 Tax=Pleuronectes platessa TaxID=8262 RepID=A0A9N7TVC5_PLEPL|nr:unnamed protein product [Pleuronectes platessa]
MVSTLIMFARPPNWGQPWKETHLQCRDTNTTVDPERRHLDSPPDCCSTYFAFECPSTHISERRRPQKSLQNPPVPHHHHHHRLSPLFSSKAINPPCNFFNCGS